MMTAMLTARNILAGERKYDVWAVNQDAEYHEAGSAGDACPSRRSLYPMLAPASLSAQDDDR